VGGFLIDRLPETDEELHWVVKALWGVTIPTQVVCPDHVAPMTAFADAYFRRNSINPDGEVQDLALWHGSRGLSGKSFLLAVLGLTEAVLLGGDVNLLGGSFEQSKNIAIHMGNSWEAPNAPRYMLAYDGAQEVRLTNRAKIRPLTASQKTVRGPHPPFLLLDEIDEMDLKILDAALGQPLPQVNYLGDLIEPYTVMCSTWQNPEGTFTEIKKRAEDRGIPVYTWCYRETSNPVDGWLTEKTIAGKKASIPAEMWRVEYELGEPSIGNRAFDSEAIERTFALPFAPLKKKESRDFEEYTFEEPERDGTYVAGADWGKEKDYTVIAVGRVDVRPHRLAYYLRVNRRPYPQMVGWFNKAVNRYSASAAHDATGLGNVINDMVDRRVRKFLMTGEKRSAMLSEYVSAIENDRWVFPKLKSAYIEHKYAQVGDLYSHNQMYHLPDTVCAFGLMEHMAKRVVPASAPLVIPRNNQPMPIEAMFANTPQRAGEVRIVSDAPSSGGINLLV